MTDFKAWFNGRSLRERRMILVMLGLLVLTILWAGIIRPVGDGLSASRERYSDAVVRLGSTAGRIEAVKSAQRDRGDALTGSLADAVRARADQAGFALASLDAEGGDRVRIAIATARPGAFFGWIATLEAQGILVDAITVTPNADRTVAVQLTLKARAA